MDGLGFDLAEVVVVQDAVVTGIGLIFVLLGEGGFAECGFLSQRGLGALAAVDEFEAGFDKVDGFHLAGDVGHGADAALRVADAGDGALAHGVG